MATLLIVFLASSRYATAAWDVVPSGTTETLTHVFFTNPDRGHVIGHHVLLTTGDGGRTWTKDTLPFPGRALFFLDANRGVLGGEGGNIRWTRNGGQTWNKAATPDTSRVQNLVLFADGSGYANGSMLDRDRFFLWKTADTGKTWTLQDTTWPRLDAPTGARTTLQGSLGAKFCFPSRNVGYIAQRLATLKTVDGGVTWRIAKHMNQDPDYPSSTFLQSCHFTDDSTGFLVGPYYGVILRTRDGMKTLQTLAYSGVDIFFSTPRVGYAVGSPSSGAQAIVRTTDGGETWTPQAVPGTPSILYKLAFTAPNTGFAVGPQGLILRTTDGGGSPVRLSPAPRQTARPRLEGLFGKLFDALGRVR